MLFLFKWREVYTGFSIEEFSKMRDILRAQKIDYKYKTVGSNQKYIGTTRRAYTGSFGENMDFSLQYYIYVKKEDEQRAKYALQTSKSVL